MMRGNKTAKLLMLGTIFIFMACNLAGCGKKQNENGQEDAKAEFIIDNVPMSPILEFGNTLIVSVKSSTHLIPPVKDI